MICFFIYQVIYLFIYSSIFIYLSSIFFPKKTILITINYPQIPKLFIPNYVIKNMSGYMVNYIANFIIYNIKI